MAQPGAAVALYVDRQRGVSAPPLGARTLGAGQPMMAEREPLQLGGCVAHAAARSAAK
jgi:hypothetical protein